MYGVDVGNMWKILVLSLTLEWTPFGCLSGSPGMGVLGLFQIFHVETFSGLFFPLSLFP